MNWNFVDASFVSSSFKVGGEEDIHNRSSLFRGDESARHDQHVCVVVETGQASNLRNPAEGGTNALMFIKGHADALAASADGYA